MSSKLPDLESLEDILSVIKSPKWTLEKKDKARILDMEFLFDIKKPDKCLELFGLLDFMGLKEGLKYLEENQEKDIDDIIRDSPAFDESRRKYFLDLTAPIRSLGNILEGIYTCTKCGSKKVKTIMKQTRSADEPATEFNTCASCGNSWTT